MAASVQNAVLQDTGDAGYLHAEALVPTAYVIGELLPQPVVVGTPPVVTIISPTPGSTISARDALVFEVVDPDGLGLERALVQTGSESDAWEQAYRDGAACPGFSVTRTAITDGYRYEVTRDAHWRSGLVRLEPVFGDTRAAESINE